jgi:hypothetical protein
MNLHAPAQHPPNFDFLPSVLCINHVCRRCKLVSSPLHALQLHIVLCSHAPYLTAAFPITIRACHDAMRPLLYVSAMLLLGVAVTAAPAFPIGCTVIMYSSYDYTLQGDGRSKCIATVESARRTCGGTRLNFIPTLYFGFTNKKLDRYCTDSGDGCAQVRQPFHQCFVTLMISLVPYNNYMFFSLLIHVVRACIEHTQHRPPSPTPAPTRHTTSYLAHCAETAAANTFLASMHLQCTRSCCFPHDAPCCPPCSHLMRHLPLLVAIFHMPCCPHCCRLVLVEFSGRLPHPPTATASKTASPRQKPHACWHPR